MENGVRETFLEQARMDTELGVDHSEKLEIFPSAYTDILMYVNQANLGIVAREIATVARSLN